MENAVDALKLAFAVIVFVMALSLTIYMFSEARTTADIVLHSSDVTYYMEYEGDVSGLTAEEINRRENRIVGLETIIPTLYKYYKENYVVIFKENSSDTGFMKLYDTKTNTDLWTLGYYNRYFGGNSTKICSFDVEEETKRHEPWVVNNKFYKDNLDAFLSGGQFVFPDGSGQAYNYSSFIEQYKNTQFIESLGEYTYNETTAGIVKERKKRVIIYTVYRGG